MKQTAFNKKDEEIFDTVLNNMPLRLRGSRFWGKARIVLTRAHESGFISVRGGDLSPRGGDLSVRGGDLSVLGSDLSVHNEKLPVHGTCCLEWNHSSKILLAYMVGRLWCMDTHRGYVWQKGNSRYHFPSKDICDLFGSSMRNLASLRANAPYVPDGFDAVEEMLKEARNPYPNNSL